MSGQRLVAVAMSGGVDSSVAAALLVGQGFNVIGVMLQLWSDPKRPNRCCSPDDMAAARQVATLLEIPFYTIDAKSVFKKHVVDHFMEGYTQGLTPNPCIQCNLHVRWGYLYQQVQALGATALATGHYARIKDRNGRLSLQRAKDRHKDQSYVLFMLDQERLSHALFPLGDFLKDEVRKMARDFSLPVAERMESQDLCFIGGGDYHDFLVQHNAPLPPPGPIFSVSGELLGQHEGLASYTIGQRKGIGISSSDPLYVIEKDVSTNTLIVGTRDQVGRRSFTVDQINWIQGPMSEGTIRVRVQVRYKAPEVDAEVQPLEGRKATVHLDVPLPDITPGQYAVFYEREECLGGGIILR
jgi:tRNA-specific 2-thiouridylase